MRGLEIPERDEVHLGPRQACAATLSGLWATPSDAPSTPLVRVGCTYRMSHSESPGQFGKMMLIFFLMFTEISYMDYFIQMELYLDNFLSFSVDSVLEIFVG